MNSLTETKSERLKAAINHMEHRWGAGILMPARTVRDRVEGLSTGFAALERLTGGGGVPLHAITLLTGNATSGKLTVAYQILRHAQRNGLTERRRSVGILDLGASTDPDYVARAGVDLDRLLLVRPQTAKQALQALLDLVRSRELKAILVDSLADLLVDREAAGAVEQMMPQVNLALKNADCALLLLDESRPLWLAALVTGSSRAVRHYASLHLEFARVGWIESDGELTGYRAQATLLKSRAQRHGETAPVTIVFDQTVRARETW